MSFPSDSDQKKRFEVDLNLLQEYKNRSEENRTLRMHHGLRPHLQRILSRIHEGVDLDKYRIIAPIGVGSNGVVYRALDTYTGKELAIKIFNMRDSENGQFGAYRDLLIRLRQLPHLALVRIEDPGHWQGLYYVPMELIIGPTGDPMNLQQYARMFKAQLDEVSLAKIFIHLLDGLSYLHDQGIVHGAIKPANVLFLDLGEGKVDQWGRWRVQLKLTDIGIYKLWGEDLYRQQILQARSELDHHRSNAADTLALCETGEFICPVWLEKDGSLTPSSDLYALGRILLMLLSGQREPVSPIEKIRSDIHAGWSDIIARAVHPDPAERFRHPKEMAQAIADLKW